MAGRDMVGRDIMKREGRTASLNESRIMSRRITSRSFMSRCIRKGRTSFALFVDLAERTGLEPATPGVTGRYSNQLNYRSKIFKIVASDE